MTNPTQLVQKLWNYCNILHEDGFSEGDYVEHLTFLLFLKMADEQAKPPLKRGLPPCWPAAIGSICRRGALDSLCPFRRVIFLRTGQEI